jgi:hypothetical protein
MAFTAGGLWPVEILTAMFRREKKSTANNELESIVT